MENSRLKFRAWDKWHKEMFNPLMNGWSLKQLVEGKVENASGSFNQYPVMQFTGLHDRNGREIYESDVVKCANGSEGVFVWSNKLAMYRLDTNQTKGGWSHPVEGFDPDTLEVIGNVHENPKLLKEAA
jgi:uncharacterized phage protein (TIGR01671 family)